MSSIKNVMLIGAGGRLGPTILSALSIEPTFRLSVLSRNGSTSTFPPNVQVQRIADDYPDHELVEAFKGQDAVISTIATASSDAQKRMADAAIKARVKRFVPSEFGGDTEIEKATMLLPEYFVAKKELVEYLKLKEKEGLTWTSFVTGWFFDMGLKFGYMGFNLREHKARILNHGNDTFSTTTLSTIGLAVKNALLAPEKTANRYMYLASFTVSPNEVLASVEKATGTKWDVTYVDGEEQKKAGLKKMASGDWNGGRPLLLQYICAVDGYGGNYATYRGSANELLGLPEETLDEVVKRVVVS